METKSKAESNAAVVATDELAMAIEAANKRASVVYASNPGTLIDKISPAEWVNWNGAEELALVADKAELDAADPLDVDEGCESEAA
jgi:hypothetical protein